MYNNPSPYLFYVKLNGEWIIMLEYVTAQQTAEKWNISLRWIQTYLKNGQIDGAIRFGHAWMSPKDTKKPTDAKVKKLNTKM